MSEVEQIVGQVPMDQVAEALGVDRAQAEQAVRTALPALLGGLQANSSDPAGAASLGAALADHDGSALGADLSSLNLDDGERIVGNIFGTNTSDVVAQLGGVRGAGGSGLIAKLLPILAPIVLAYLSKKLQQQGGLGGVLGDVVGGGASSQQPSQDSGSLDQPSGPLIPTGPADTSPTTTSGAQDAGGSGGPLGGSGGLGDILGQILGGGAGGSSASPGGNILGGILGGLLGGGKR